MEFTELILQLQYVPGFILGYSTCSFDSGKIHLNLFFTLLFLTSLPFLLTVIYSVHCPFHLVVTDETKRKIENH